MSFKVRIETIPYDQMAYPTPGDYYWSHNGTLVIQVAELGDWRYEYLVALHELEEVARCRHRNISLKQIEDFDLAFEASRMADDDSEPGMASDCPYRQEHLEATATEMQAAAALGVDWMEYEAAINKLVWPEGKPVDSRGSR